jgi:hypothetical protein
LSIRQPKQLARTAPTHLLTSTPTNEIAPGAGPGRGSFFVDFRNC